MAQKINKIVYSRTFLDTVRVVMTVFLLIPIFVFLKIYYPSILWETRALFVDFSLAQLSGTFYYYREFVFPPLIMILSLFLNRKNRPYVKITMLVYLVVYVYTFIPDIISGGVPQYVGVVPDMSADNVNLGFMHFYGFWTDVAVILYCFANVMVLFGIVKTHFLCIPTSLFMLVMSVWKCSCWLYMILIYDVKYDNVETLFIKVLFSLSMFMYSIVRKRKKVITK